MSIAWITKRIVLFGVALGLVALGGCEVAETSRRLPGGYRLIQKQQYQALYGPGGRIERLLQDRNHDGRADAVILYYPNGMPERGELDTNGDGLPDKNTGFQTYDLWSMRGTPSSKRRTGPCEGECA